MPLTCGICLNESFILKPNLLQWRNWGEEVFVFRRELYKDFVFACFLAGMEPSVTQKFLDTH